MQKLEPSMAGDKSILASEKSILLLENFISSSSGVESFRAPDSDLGPVSFQRLMFMGALC